MHPSLYQNLSPSQAISFQNELRKNIALKNFDKDLKTIGGADISFNKYEKTIYAGIVVLSYPELQIIHSSGIISETNFPYISGLLAFREIPALIEVYNQLQLKPDLMILDGQGIAHERRMGIATHFGILTQSATIGCAKSNLKGKYIEPKNILFDKNLMIDKGEEVGYALKSKLNCKPIFISPGHHITSNQSVEIIKKCITKYRIPEPTRLAHEFVNNLRINAMSTSPKKLF